VPDFTAKDVQTLRQASGAGMLDAKRALEASGGDMDEAAKWLRVQGLGSADKRAGREATQGAVAVAKEGNAAAVVELKCETDFVAKSDEFVSLADELAALVVAKGEAAVAERQDEVDRLRTTLKENISVGEVVRIEADADGVVDTYLHLQAGRGVNAVIVAVKGGDETLAHDIAAHIAFTRPSYITRDEVPAAEVDAERATVEEIARNEGKPDAALPKIIEGRLNGWYKNRVLVDQAYIRDEKQTIGKLLGSAVVTRFAQVVIGD
jgi:elongation factor Ts